MSTDEHVAVPDHPRSKAPHCVTCGTLLRRITRQYTNQSRAVVIWKHRPVVPMDSAEIDALAEGLDLLVLDPRDVFDPAFLGIVHQGGMHMALYSEAKVIEALIADGMDEDDAREHYSFNVSGSIGLQYPVFLLDENDDA